MFSTLVQSRTIANVVSAMWVIDDSSHQRRQRRSQCIACRDGDSRPRRGTSTLEDAPSDCLASTAAQLPARKHSCQPYGLIGKCTSYGTNIFRRCGHFGGGGARVIYEAFQTRAQPQRLVAHEHYKARDACDRYA
jgi:hypothetical protein